MHVLTERHTLHRAHEPKWHRIACQQSLGTGSQYTRHIFRYELPPCVHSQTRGWRGACRRLLAGLAEQSACNRTVHRLGQRHVPHCTCPNSIWTQRIMAQSGRKHAVPASLPQLAAQRGDQRRTTRRPGVAAHRPHARNTHATCPRPSPTILYMQHSPALLLYTGSRTSSRPMQARAHSPGHTLFHSRAPVTARQGRSTMQPALGQSLRIVKSYTGASRDRAGGSVAREGRGLADEARRCCAAAITATV